MSQANKLPLLCGAAMILLLMLLLLLPPSLLRPFHSKGEPREALVAQGMIRSGNWVLPLRYGDETATKPPMTHWLIAISSIADGKVTEVSARAPSFILAIATVIILFFFLHSRTPGLQGFYTAIVLTSSFLWYRSAAAARVDMTLSAFVTISLLLLFRWEEESLRVRSIQSFGASMALAASLLTKGPVGVVLPVLIFAVYLLLEGYHWRRVACSSILVAAVASFLGSIWYLVAYLQQGNEFLRVVFAENFARFTGTMSEGNDPHEHSVFYLIGTLFLGFAPWSLLAIPILGAKLKTEWAQISFRNSAWTSVRTRLAAVYELSKLERYCLLVVLGFIFFFAIPASKRPEYLLPSYPFLAILGVACGVRHPESIRQSLRWVNPLILSVIVGLYIAVPSLYFGSQIELLHLGGSDFVGFLTRLVDRLRHDLSVFAWATILVPGITALLSLTCHRGISKRLHNFGFVPTYFTFLIVAGAFIVPPLASELSVVNFARQLEELPVGNRTLCSPERLYGMSFYLGAPLEVCKLDDESTVGKVIVVDLKTFNRYVSQPTRRNNVSVLQESADHMEKPGRRLVVGLVQRRE